MSDDVVEEKKYEPSLRDLCEAEGWDFIDLARKLDPPMSNTMVSLWSRGLRPLPAQIETQMAQLLHTSEDRIKRAVAEGARRHQLREQYLLQVASAASPVPPRRARRKSSVA